MPPPSAAHVSRLKPVKTVYNSTQLDSFNAACGFGVNETTIAQSTTDPNVLVGGANTYYDDVGGCQDSHAGVYYSADGGQHWRFEVMPGLLFPSSGDPVVTFDPVRQVFVYAFVEFNRNNKTQGRIGVEVSADGHNWSRNVTLDSNNSSYGTDKPSITVDQNPGSPHYGRVLVAWTDFAGNNAIYHTAYTDDGGVNWTAGNASVNQTSHECGNGTSAAFNANGEAMVAWADCTGGTNSVYEELSTDGGLTWSTGVDRMIATTHPIAGAEDPNPAHCFLNNGGSAFRCNSFPSLAGDPNGGDAGGTAFVVTWADIRSTTQSGQTASVSQLTSLSTVSDGSTWDHPAFMAFNDFGDKFFPAASFSPNGRLTVSYSSREGDATAGNPNGKKFNEHQTEASSLTNLRNGSYVSYTTDATLGDAGSLTFIGDYAGNTSQDQNFDTFPIWTDLRSGLPSARTQDLCYADCMTFLTPDLPVSVSQTAGSTFSDFYRLSIDPLGGSGQNFWNVVALRAGSDGTSVDDDAFLSPDRYFDVSLATSAFGPPHNDYLLVNANAGHAPNAVYFPQVHSFSASGGPYSIQWDAGHFTIGTALPAGMSGSDVGRVYDTFLTTGTTYFLGLRPDPGDTSNYTLALHSASGAAEQGRGSAVADSGNVTPGTPAFVQRDTGGDPSQFDGVVVLNNNGGAGTYTLYRDTAAPSGSITIDGGAESTNKTTLHLTLAATNPTAGDPVSDMAFSINGGAFGAFQPFSTTAALTVPGGEGSKTVAVEYRNGAGAVSSPATSAIYLVQKAPAVGSVAPRAGSTAGGNMVTITGNHFAPGATVLFGTVSSPTVTFVSGTELMAKAPSHPAGTVDLVVTTPAGTSPTSKADLYAFGVPTITGIAPNTGPPAGGNTVTITGKGFVPGAKVYFGATASSSVTYATGKLQAVVPAGSAGTVRVIVRNPAGGSASTTADLYAYGSPTVTSISPATGSHAGGTTVTVNGTGFVPGATVAFGATSSATVTIVSGTRLKAVSPAHATGTVHIRVTTGAGTSPATNADRYTYS